MRLGSVEDDDDEIVHKDGTESPDSSKTELESVGEDEMMDAEGRACGVVPFVVVVRSSRAQTFWLWELLESFMPQEEATKVGSGLADPAKSKLLAKHVRLLWPSVEAVRTSAKGWASGGYVLEISVGAKA